MFHETYEERTAIDVPLNVQFDLEDLQNSPNATAPWDGVRNYQVTHSRPKFECDGHVPHN